MTVAASSRGPLRGLDADARAAWLLTAALTLVRLVALFRTPLELYPDEAQYWLWSRTLAFGYYSKPPVIAWAIWASTALGGDGEAWVRLPAVLLHAGAAMLVFAIARRLYGASAALAAAALYALMPAVQLSSLVIATDAPLLFFLGLTLLAYVAMAQAEGGRRLALAAGLGAALGLAFLSKYAAIYAVIGLVLHAAISAEGRRRWSPASLILMLAVFGVVLAPNLAWNAAHGFQTLHHTAANAAWGGSQLFNGPELGQFLATQFAVFGPVPFCVLLIGGVLIARRRALAPADVMLLCFIVPPLLIVSVQAFISRANANWSGASYLPGAILVAGWLVRWRAKKLLIAAFAIQAGIAALFLVFVLSPRTADRLGAANSFKRARGWAETTRLVADRVRAEEAAAPVSAIVVNNRFLYYSLAYYGRNLALPPVRAWLLEPDPQNQSEASAPLTTATGRHALAVVYEGWKAPQLAADFNRASAYEIDRVQLDRKHDRRLVMFMAEGFAPRPRDPRTGLPTPP